MNRRTCRLSHHWRQSSKSDIRRGEGTHWADHNARFAQPPAAAEDVHRRTPSKTTLDAVFQLETTRVLSNDWIVQYDGRQLQVTRQTGQAPARSTVVVRENEAGVIEIRYRGHRLAWRPPVAAPTSAPRPAPVLPGRCRPPNADHPWRRDTRATDAALALCRAASR